MRILILTQYFWPESFPINGVALRLRERGHEVTVLTGQPNYPEGRFREGYGFRGPRRESHEGVDIRRVPLVPRGNGGAVRMVLNYLTFAFFASLLGPRRAPGPYDAMLVYEPSPITVGIPGLVLRRKHRLPMAFWVQDLWPESLTAAAGIRNRWILRATAWLVRTIYAGCDLILAPSRSFMRAIEEHEVEPERIRYLPNSVKPIFRPLSPADAERERKLVPHGFVVMFAGNIGAAQGWDTILAAAERTRDRSDVHWVILGEGRRFERVRQQVAERGLGDAVHLLGWHPIESMPRFFALADVLLVSLRRVPAFASTIPTKIPAYLACGRPVLAALEGEGAQVIEEAGAGWVVPPEDAEQLAAAVLHMAALPGAEREAMGRAGRAYFEQHFEGDRLAARLAGWLDDLAAGREPAGGEPEQRVESRCAS